MRAFLFYTVSFTSILLAGCAQRMDEVEERVTDVQKRTAALEAKMGQPIGSDRELLEGQKLADVRSEVAAMRNEITVLNGRVEALEYDNKNLMSRLDQLNQDIMLAKAKEMQGSSSSKPSAADANDPESQYNAALRAHQDGDFDKSEKMFLEFYKKHPKDPLASHALFWIGDGYMQKKEYKKAIVKFQDLLEKYPKSEKRCDALGKQITCLKELKQNKDAAAFSKLKAAECK